MIVFMKNDPGGDAIKCSYLRCKMFVHIFKCNFFVPWEYLPGSWECSDSLHYRPIPGHSTPLSAH